jgi:hypothetical protein
MSSLAAAITIPVTNAAKPENSRSSFSILVAMIRSPVQRRPLKHTTRQRTPVPWQNGGGGANGYSPDDANRANKGGSKSSGASRGAGRDGSKAALTIGVGRSGMSGMPRKLTCVSPAANSSQMPPLLPRASPHSRGLVCDPHDAQRRASTATASLPAPQPPS